MRTFEDIIPPSRRKETGQPPVSSGSGRPPARESRRRPRVPFTFIGIALVILVSFGVLVYFSSAEVDVTPNTVSAAVQNSFTADQSTGGLPFKVVTAQKIASQSVAANGTKDVSSVASGTITVYNTQARAQRLITNTRFATASGLVFRIHVAIVVPAGTPAKPGSVQATVYADQLGDSYNVGPTSFTIPGLAGTAAANEVYARSTAAMTGGASGTVPVVDAATESKTRAALVAALAPDLESSIATQIPEGYVLMPGAATTTYEDIAIASSTTGGMADVKEQGTETAVVFPNAALAGAIASSIPDLASVNTGFTLGSTSGLTLMPTDSLSDLNGQSSFAFSLSGTASLIYTVNPTRIAAAIAGKTRSAAEVALTNYPEVKKAIIILRPFWRQEFPQDPSSISVVVNPAD